jgi:hypothetical protein
VSTPTTEYPIVRAGLKPTGSPPLTRFCLKATLGEVSNPLWIEGKGDLLPIFGPKGLKRGGRALFSCSASYFCFRPKKV